MWGWLTASMRRAVPRGPAAVCATAVLALPAFAFVATVAPDSALAAAARVKSVVVLRAATSGYQVFRFAVTSDTVHMLVRWGDGTSSQVSRFCKVGDPSTVTMFVPHRYARNGHFNIRVTAGRPACGQALASAHASRSVSLTVRNAQAAHAAAALVPAQSNWTTYGQTTSLANPTFTVATGQPVAGGGCLMTPPALTLVQGGPRIVREDEQAADPATCSALYEIGTPPIPLVAQTATVWENQGYYNTWFQDPVGLHTDHVNLLNTWRWNGGCTTEQVNYGMNANPDIGGWYRSYANVYGSQDCNHARTYGNAGFWSNNFCSPNATYNTWYHIELLGYYNGSMSGDAGYASNGSACSSALSWHGALAWGYYKVFIHN